MKSLVCDFSGIYREQKFCNGENFRWLDCSKIRGTDCYLDDEAKAEIQKIFAQEELRNIHFIDSGNYHYLSKLWTDRIQEKFNLLVFDHHSDMQAPAFEGILSCGGWVKATLDENPFLQNVFLFGIREDHALAIEKKYRSRVFVKTETECAQENFEYELPAEALSFPVNISLDKDALPENELKTNWDAGSFPLKKWEKVLQKFIGKNSVLGIDICGEPSIQREFSEDLEQSNQINFRLEKWLRKLFE